VKKYSIIIPTYNRPKLLDELLDSLIVQQFNPDNFEILIVDNNSKNDVQQQIADFVKDQPKFDIKYIKETQQGLPYAWNTGIKNAQGQLLIFVDDDITFHKDYFARLEQDFAENLDNIAGGGKVAPVFEYQKPAWINKYVMPYFAEINLGEKTVFPKNKTPFATNMLISKNIFDKVGLFNTKLVSDENTIPPGTFERDLFERIKQENIPVYYYHDLVVWHFIPQEKINKAYVKDKAIENGKTLRDIYKSKGIGWYLYALWKDIAKWLAAVVLTIYYIFTTQWEKAGMLFKLRWWRSKGLWKFGK
jgi:glycosyltransferase involved in cell wall biosynthesis